MINYFMMGNYTSRTHLEMDMIYGSANILKHGFIGHEEVTKFDARRGPTIDNTSPK